MLRAKLPPRSCPLSAAAFLTAARAGLGTLFRGRSASGIVVGFVAVLTTALAACTTTPGMPEPLRDQRNVSVTAWSWGYEPSILQVKQGQRIRMTLQSLDVAHSLVNERIGVNAPIPARGEPAAVYEFIAPTFGEYVFHSETPSGPGISQMQMRLVVMR